MKITNITDCKGMKFNAIHGIFKGHYKMPNHTVETFTVDSLEVKTPLVEALFLTSLNRRLQNIQSRNIAQDANYFSSIQRGYFFENGIYHFKAIVGITDYSGKMCHAYTSTVPIDKEVSEKKYEDPELNIGKLLAEKFPDFVFGNSVYEYLTKEDEALWLQQPLRYCLKELLR